MQKRENYLYNSYKCFKDTTLYCEPFSDIDIVYSFFNEHEKYVYACHPSGLKLEHRFKSKEELKLDKVVEESILVLFSSINSGHALSELSSQYYEFKRNGVLGKKLSVYIPYFIDKLPLIKALLPYLFKNSEIIIMKQDGSYLFKEVHIARGEWLATGILEDKYIIENGDVLELDSRHLYFLETTGVYALREKVKEIYEENKHRYKLFENICIIKSTFSDNCLTPGRSLVVDKSVVDYIKEKSYEFLLIDSKSDYLELVCQIYHAKNILTSYGCINCTNRMFFNQEAVIREIANNAYYDEYKDLSHIVCTSMNVRKYLVFRNIDNLLTKSSLDFILD